MPSIFLSYRRSDSAGHAGRLYDRLVAEFGAASVFRDVDSIEPGADFSAEIMDTVGRCDSLVSVIGPNWLNAEHVGRRLEDSQDWVRLEIGAALVNETRVVPVLVGGAAMPSAGDLPDELKQLARCHAIELSEGGWAAQVESLISGTLAKPLVLTGDVKWYDDEKGYGFITADGGGRDLFVHFSGIARRSGVNGLTEGARVTYERKRGDRGPMATNVRAM